MATVLTFAAGWGAWQFIPASTPPSAAPDVIAPQLAVPRLASVAVAPSFAKRSTPPVRVLPRAATEPSAREASVPGAREASAPAPTSSAPLATREPASASGGETESTRTTALTELVSGKATTWVNVRAEADGQSAIVGIVRPDSIVELGESRRGWRRVSTRSFSGWAAAKLFTVDTLNR